MRHHHATLYLLANTLGLKSYGMDILVPARQYRTE